MTKLLPSREVVATLLNDDASLYGWLGANWSRTLMKAYVSGRLVDREDREQLIAALGIDYEAAVPRLAALSGWSEVVVRAWVKETLGAALVGASNDASEVTEE